MRRPLAVAARPLAAIVGDGEPGSLVGVTSTPARFPMLFAGRCFGPSLPLVWRVFLTNAAMLTAATLALALSPATVSFPLALTEAVVLGGGLAATLSLDLVALRRAFGSSVGATAAGPEVEGPLQPYAVIPRGDVVWAPPST